jgi:2,3,4,5-tetrahydropyridine-2-carboxylate N-succinyltransferase
VGLASVSDDGATLDTWYPYLALGAPSEESEAVDLSSFVGTDAGRGVRRSVVRTVIEDLAASPRDPADAYLRLHLLSHRLVRPHGLNLDGLFGVLPTVCWTNLGPCAVQDFEQTRLRLRRAGHLVQVFGVDKFPRMTDYVVPSGVRIADADRVRLGAHLAAGTTVMQEGFVNYNAGTLGASMVEDGSAPVSSSATARTSAAGIDHGTLSGGGKHTIAIGSAAW